MAAKLKGGDVYTAPQIELCTGEDGVSSLPEGTVLHPVDLTAMTEKNHPMLTLIEQTTVKKIIAVYEKYRARLDCFHVAFSGGKDSCVLLDLVKKALPQGSFVVVFGDTGMEFPDTYALVDHVEEQCRTEGIPFYRAASHFTPTESWQLFGPPSRTLRWCCSVHKSTPQVLKLREITGKHDYRGLAFVGVRGHESARRAQYEYLSDGTKVKGQISHNSILDWTSAEIWLYLYTYNIFFNEAYKKGSARVGCLCCPMGGGKASHVEQRSYPAEADAFYEMIAKSNGRRSIQSEDYIAQGGWNARKNGRFLEGNQERYTEYTKRGKIIIEVKNPYTHWKEWMKTLGEVVGIDGKYEVIFRGEKYAFSVMEQKHGYRVTFSEMLAKHNPIFSKVFRQVFRKTTFCVACKTCQAMCKYGCISFDSGLHITNCHHCLECHTISGGCYVYDSRKIPREEGSRVKTINCFSNHAPKEEWLQAFFSQQAEFLQENTLGSVQKTKFKRFLKDAELIDNEEITDFARFGVESGWNSTVFLGMMLLNLSANNPQFSWYIKTMDVDRIYSREEMTAILSSEGQSTSNIASILSSFRRINTTSFGTVLNFGYVTEDGELCRTKCALPDARVFLYGLFKFAEACGDYKAFTLRTLLDDGIERDGISPTQIFGVTRAEAEPMLRGLTARYPEFIDAAFTHDLEKITLAEDRTAADVLGLLRTEGA